MIDTDKYEGHDTDKRMKLLFRDNLLHLELSDADYHLLADAPLLLAEVERLRELVDNLYDFAKRMQDKKHKDPIGLEVLKDRMYWRDEE